MERRRFLWICGLTGLGAVVGWHPAPSVRAIGVNDLYPAWRPKPVWMHGSAKTGCAHLPGVELSNAENELPSALPEL